MEEEERKEKKYHESAIAMAASETGFVISITL